MWRSTAYRALQAASLLGQATSSSSRTALSRPQAVSHAAAWCLQTQLQPSRSYADAAEEVREIGSERVRKLAEEILALNLLEVADLSEILKQRLNLTGMPAMGMPMAMPAAGIQPGAAAAAAPPPEAKPEKTEFDLVLKGFDAAAKIKVIKEVRGMTDLGLKEAKELVEKAPAVLKKGLKKEEAEKLKQKLEEAGGKVELA